MNFMHLAASTPGHKQVCILCGYSDAHDGTARFHQWAASLQAYIRFTTNNSHVLPCQEHEVARVILMGAP